MQQPIQTKKSAFIERWSNAESINARLGLAMIVMGLVSLALVGTVIYLTVKPRPVYYVPGVESAGVAYAQINPKTTVAMFAAAWVLNWSNFTPVNVEGVYKHAQQFMSPRLLGQTRNRLKKDLEEIKRNNISSLFSLSQDPTVQEEQRGFSVTIKGEKGIYMGREEIKLQKMIYHLRLRQSPATDWNPYGLIIEDISQEISL